MPTTFRRVVLAHTNDFPGKLNEQIRSWIDYHGGRFSKEITPEVTHLVASKQAWKRYSPLVKAARQDRTIHIVKLDWLEDSLTIPSKRPLPEAKYYFEKARVRKKPINGPSQRSLESYLCYSHNEFDSAAGLENLEAQKRQRMWKRIKKSGRTYEKACREKQEQMAGEGYHPYVDSNGMPYLVTLVRADIHEEILEKHHLQVRCRDTSPPPLPRSIPISIPPSTTLMVAQTYPPDLPFSALRRPYNPIVLSKKRASSYLRRSRGLPQTSPALQRPYAECLQLYESDNTPRKYTLWTQYTKRCRNGMPTVIDQEILGKGATWDLARDTFIHFLEKKILKSSVMDQQTNTPVVLECEKETESSRLRLDGLVNLQTESMETAIQKVLENGSDAFVPFPSPKWIG